jgi:hypothetical protein
MDERRCGKGAVHARGEGNGWSEALAALTSKCANGKEPAVRPDDPAKEHGFIDTLAVLAQSTGISANTCAYEVKWVRV